MGEDFELDPVIFSLVLYRLGYALFEMGIVFFRRSSIFRQRHHIWLFAYFIRRCVEGFYVTI